MPPTTPEPDAPGLLSIRQAAAQGIERLRKPIWASEFDHLKLDILADGKPGPWTHLYCPCSKEFNGRDPVDISIVDPFLNMNYDEPCFVAYIGPLPESEEYKAEAAKYDGCLGGSRSIVLGGKT